MNFISILHFASFAVYVLLIIYLLSRSQASRLNQLCALFISAIAIVSLSLGLLNLISNYSDAMALVNLGGVGWCCGPIFALWFYLAICSKERWLKNKIFLSCSIIISLICVYLQWSGSLANGLETVTWGTAVTWTLSPFSYVYVAYNLLLSALSGLLMLELAIKASEPRRRKQAILLLTTWGASALSVISIAILIHQFGMKSLPQVPDVLLLIWVIGIVIATSRYGLMRITPVLASDEILRTMSDSLMLANNEGLVVYANRATCSLLRAPEREVVGKRFYSFVEDENKARMLLADTRKNNKEDPVELSFTTGIGTTIPVLVSTSAIRDLQGELAGFVISATDMTRHKIAEMKLAAHEKLLDGIIESMPSAVLVIRQWPQGCHGKPPIPSKVGGHE